MDHEKNLESIRVHLPESLKLDLMEIAIQQDRKLSELVRFALEDWTYGQARHACKQGPNSHDRGR
jgi:hypothetical protein